jgi:hypothetical protein
VNDTAGVVDDEHGGCQRVERVSECCGLDLMTVDDVADQKRAADVRDDEAEPLPKFVIREAIGDVTHHRENGTTGRRFLNVGKNDVDETLRHYPFARELRSAEILVRQAIGN